VNTIKQIPSYRETVATLFFLSVHALSFAQTNCPSSPGSRTPKAPQTAVQIDNAESTAKPDDVQTPEANPSRPTITNPAHIPPVGYLQFEQGFVEAYRSPSLARQFSLNQSFRLSLHPRLMLQFSSQPLAQSRLPDSPGNASNPATDPGDLTLGLQAVLVKESGPKPAIALNYLHRVRAGSAPDLDIGSFSQSGVLLLSGDLGKFHYDTNFIVSEQLSDPVRRAQFGQTLSVTHEIFPKSLHDKLALTGEVWHLTQPLVHSTRSGDSSPRSNAVATLWALGYTLRPNLVLDAGFDRGLTSTSTAWQGFAGFTYLLPHRLWQHRDTTLHPPHPGHVQRR